MKENCSRCGGSIEVNGFSFETFNSIHGKEETVCKVCAPINKWWQNLPSLKIGGGKAFVPDVYWDGKPEENLADDPITGEPRVFSSKLDKFRYLQEKGLQEAGDRVHGAPVQLSQNQNRKADTRVEVQEALRKVKQMSPDYRHQEYLRITKEGQRYARS